MKRCTRCTRTFPDEAVACIEHGEALIVDPLLGTVLSGFSVDAPLALGATGVLYRARHEQIKKQAAIKVIRFELLADPNALARFEREARVVSQVGHPHLIDIFDFGITPDGRAYFVMELLEGRSLAARMAQRRLSFAEFGPLLRDACGAVEAVHATGVVHRDLKPENLFLVERAGEAPFLKVIDFAVAKAVEDGQRAGPTTLPGGLGGAPRYLSPEQIAGAGADRRSDVYSLGAILYELATGRPPYFATTPAGVLAEQATQPIAAFDSATLSPEVPVELESIVRKAMARDPAERYQSVRELREALEPILPRTATHARRLVPRDDAPASPGAATLHAAGGVPGLPRSQQPTAPSAFADTLVEGSEPSSAAPPATGTHAAAHARALSRRWQAVRVAAIAAGLTLGIGGALIAVAYVLRRPVPELAARDLGVEPPIDVAALRSKALAVIGAALKDGDPAARRRAVEAMGAAHDLNLTTTVTPLLADPDLQVRAAAAVALSELGGRSAIQALRAALGKEPAVDVWIAEALLKLSAEPGKKRLQGMLKDGPERPRFSAALVLADGGDLTARALLDARLAGAPTNDPATVSLLWTLARGGETAARSTLLGRLADGQGDDRVQIALAEATARLGLDAGVAKLKSLAARKDVVGLRAYRILASLDDQSGYDRFREVLAAPGLLEERVLAAQGLGASAEKAALRVLGPVLDESEPALRLAAAGAVLSILAADPKVLAARALEWSTGSLTDSSWDLREQAVSVLADADPNVAVPLLGKALVEDARVEVRRAAATSLGRTRSSAAVPFLGRALDDKEPTVRVEAMRSMGRIGDRAAVPLLSRHLALAAPAEKMVAVGQLLKLGEHGSEAELQKGLASQDPEVRRLAVEESAAAPDLERQSALGALKDQAPSVRLAAALQLADRGAKEGVAVLQAALKNGGADALRAYAALTRLGVKPDTATEPQQVLDAPDVNVRLDGLRSATALPPERALAFLQRALHDPEPRVRLAAAEAAFDLAGLHRPLVRGILALLRSAGSDGNPAVRAKADELAARLAPAIPARPTTTAEPPTPTPPQPLPVAAVDLAAPPAPLVDAAALPAPPDATAPPPLSHETPTAPARPEPPAPPARAELDEGHLAMTSGEIALRAGHYQSAIEELQRAQKLNPQLPIHFSLGEAYRRLGDGEISPARRRDHYQKAIRSYQKSRDKRAASYAAELAQRIK